MTSTTKSKPTAILTGVQNDVTVVALLDPHEPALTSRGKPFLPEPDFVEDGMAYWIGENGVAGIALNEIGRLSDLLERGGWLARSGQFPCEQGVFVQPHNPAYEDASARILGKRAPQQSAWTLFREVLGR